MMTTRSDYVPEQGDIAWLVLDPRIGHEQSGRRPVIVISDKALALHTRLAVVIPITSKIKSLPYEVVLTGTKTRGVILPIHIRSVDYAMRKADFIEKAPSAVLYKTVKSVQNMIAGYQAG